MEMSDYNLLENKVASPSARKVWIEIMRYIINAFSVIVTFREEGVD